MGRDEDVYEAAGSFKPERWMKPERGIQTFDEYAFPVFNAGPRICLGKDLSMYEAKTLLVELMRRFKFELPPENRPKNKNEFEKDVTMLNGETVYHLNFTMSFKGKLNLLVQGR